MADGPKISIIVVNFNAERLLKECLESLYRETQDTPFDVWVVDNNSRDESVRMVREDFPQVNLIENDDNLGFSKANNQAIAKSASDYILLLNPDTVVRDRAIDKMVAFMDAHPDVGISGCRVLNKDGSLQPACRRSVPTPKVAFYHLSGLSKLFPNSMIMAKYNLTYLDPDQSHEVDAVSGAFLLIRRAVVDQIGLLDEVFFIYGEDVDWCVRAKQAGWKVMYHPEAEILHYKGGCSANSRRTAYEFYRAMYLFHRKHFAKDHSPVANLLICTGIVIRAMLSWRRFFASAKAGPGS
jgi:GT2 family glycosyltransferase